MNKFGVTYLLKGGKLSLDNVEYSAIDAQKDESNIYLLLASGKLLKNGAEIKSGVTSFVVDDKSTLVYIEKDAKDGETVKRLQAAATFKTIVYRYPSRYMYTNTIKGGLYTDGAEFVTVCPAGKNLEKTVKGIACIVKGIFEDVEYGKFVCQENFINKENVCTCEAPKYLSINGKFCIPTPAPIFTISPVVDQYICDSTKYPFIVKGENECVCDLQHELKVDGDHKYCISKATGKADHMGIKYINGKPDKCTGDFDKLNVDGVTCVKTCAATVSEEHKYINAAIFLPEQEVKYCLCATGYELDFTGHCAAKEHFCPENSVKSGDTCICNSGYHMLDFVCE